MRKLTFAVMFAFVITGTVGAAYAHDERVHVASTDCGTVETVRAIVLADPVREVLEHAVNPDTAHELVIRTDDGRTVVLRQADLRDVRPGQRVRLLSGSVVPHPDLP